MQRSWYIVFLFVCFGGAAENLNAFKNTFSQFSLWVSFNQMPTYTYLPTYPQTLFCPASVGREWAESIFSWFSGAHGSVSLQGYSSPQGPWAGQAWQPCPFVSITSQLLQLYSAIISTASVHHFAHSWQYRKRYSSTWLYIPSVVMKD